MIGIIRNIKFIICAANVSHRNSAVGAVDLSNLFSLLFVSRGLLRMARRHLATSSKMDCVEQN